MNEDGREILNCRWLAEAALDALAVFDLRGSFLGYLSVLVGIPSYSAVGNDVTRGNGSGLASEPLIGALLCGRSFAPSWRRAFSG